MRELKPIQPSQELLKDWLTLPSNFMLFSAHPYYEEIQVDHTWALAVLTTHRDADYLTRSNWEVLHAWLTKHPEFTGDWYITQTSCSMVGWQDHLSIKVYDDAGSITEIAKYMADMQAMLDDYPVLDEDHFSQLEHDAEYQYWWREFSDTPERYGWGEERDMPTEDEFSQICDYLPDGMGQEVNCDTLTWAVNAYLKDHP